jgi:hypothetical protein
MDSLHVKQLMFHPLAWEWVLYNHLLRGCSYVIRGARQQRWWSGMLEGYARAVCSDKICMMMTRLACNQAIESSYWRMDNNSDVGLLMGYVLYRLPIELESMDLDTFSR